MQYKAIGFDYGGVINGKPGSFFTEKFCEFVGVSKEEYKKVYFAYNRKFNADEPITERELWTYVLTDLNKIEKLDGVMNLVNEFRLKKELNKNVLQLVDNLRSKSYRTGLLSNNNQEAAGRMRRDGLDKHFDVFIVSAEVGVMKPDPEIFQLFIEKLQVKPEELIFIDDAEKSLSSAKECGFKPLLFKSYQNLVNDLKTLQVI
jgi:epoxide hydrolase-like predicted phosphatase